MMNDADFIGYCRDTYQLQADCPRFGTGEAKGTLKESVRGTICISFAMFSIMA